jgi:hypothetical protein
MTARFSAHASDIDHPNNTNTMKLIARLDQMAVIDQRLLCIGGDIPEAPLPVLIRDDDGNVLHKITHNKSSDFLTMDEAMADVNLEEPSETCEQYRQQLLKNGSFHSPNIVFDDPCLLHIILTNMETGEDFWCGVYPFVNPMVKSVAESTNESAAESMSESDKSMEDDATDIVSGDEDEEDEEDAVRLKLRGLKALGQYYYDGPLTTLRIELGENKLNPGEPPGTHQIMLTLQKAFYSETHKPLELFKQTCSYAISRFAFLAPVQTMQQGF